MKNRTSWRVKTACAVTTTFILLTGIAPAVAAPVTSDVSAAFTESKTSKPDSYESAAQMAIALSFPLHGAGKTADPRSRIAGGPGDKELASALYKTSKVSAWEKSVQYGSTFPAWPGESYANCSAFTATAVIHTLDPTFPGNFTNKQREYVEDRSNGWVKVADSESGYNREKLEPGDIFLSKPKTGVMGHTWMWIGDHEGKRNVISQASFGSIGKTAQLPALQLDPILVANKADGTDRLGRAYDAWRYSGAKKSLGSKIGMTDLNRDKIPDIYAMHTSTGELLHYSGKSSGGLNNNRKLGTQWKGLRIVTPGDFDGDGNADLIAVNEKSGQLYLYAGKPNGTFKTGVQIGRGFNTIRSLMSVGDFDGDGFSDLIGIHKTTNKLHLWPGNGKNGLKPIQQLGTGWGNMEVASGADMNADGKADILAKSTSGNLYLYPGNGAGKLKTRLLLGNGWKDRTVMSPGDLDRDGFADIVYRENKTGYLHLARGSRGGKIKSHIRIGTGWNALNQTI